MIRWRQVSAVHHDQVMIGAVKVMTETSKGFEAHMTTAASRDRCFELIKCS